jgi:hypothetical protein
MESNTILALLLCLTMIVLIIYLYNQDKPLEKFYDIDYTDLESKTPAEKQYIIDAAYTKIALDSNIEKQNQNINKSLISDINFIMDDSLSLIQSPILNHKLSNDKYLSIFHHRNLADKYNALGQYIHISDTPIIDFNTTITTLLKTKKSLRILTSSTILPISYRLIWSSDINEDGNIITVWHPNAPVGTIAMGDIVIMGTNPPELSYTRCLPINILQQTKLSNGILWNATNDMNKKCYCWGATNIDLFRASNEYNDEIPELNTVYNLPDTYLNLNTISQIINSNSVSESKGFSF